MVIETLFYVTAIGCVYSYFFYPLILMLIPCREKKPSIGLCESELPYISIIIAVHNEELKINEKLENTLQIDYPRNLIEIIVASDCSTDSTDTIVDSHTNKGIQLVRIDERKGKEYAQWCAIQESKGSVIVFSDAATQIPEESLRVLISQFQDQKVGAVSSEDRFITNEGKLEGEGVYLKYEMWLRRLESKRAGLVGLSGSFFAARREVCKKWDFSTCSDFNMARNCACMDMVAISCPEVVGYYKHITDPRMEYPRKVRTVLRGITAISRHVWVLNPLRMGVFAFEVWSHKIMRWAVPWFMLIFLAMTLSLTLQGDRSPVFMFALMLQVIFYIIVVIGWVFKKTQENAFVHIIFFFMQSNIAIADALLKYLLGKRVLVWKPSQR